MLDIFVKRESVSAEYNPLAGYLISTKYIFRKFMEKSSTVHEACLDKLREVITYYHKSWKATKVSKIHWLSFNRNGIENYSNNLILKQKTLIYPTLWALFKYTLLMYTQYSYLIMKTYLTTVLITKFTLMISF